MSAPKGWRSLSQPHSSGRFPPGPARRPCETASRDVWWTPCSSSQTTSCPEDGEPTRGSPPLHDQVSTDWDERDGSPAAHGPPMFFLRRGRSGVYLRGQDRWGSFCDFSADGLRHAAHCLHAYSVAHLLSFSTTYLEKFSGLGEDFVFLKNFPNNLGACVLVPARVCVCMCVCVHTRGVKGEAAALAPAHPHWLRPSVTGRNVALKASGEPGGELVCRGESGTWGPAWLEASGSRAREWLQHLASVPDLGLTQLSHYWVLFNELLESPLKCSAFYLTFYCEYLTVYLYSFRIQYSAPWEKQFQNRSGKTMTALTLGLRG